VAASVGFTILIALLSPLLASVPHLPDKGPWWYFWKLATPTFASHFTAWAGYALHQVALWTVIVLMMREKPHPGRLSRLNIAAFAINGAFIALHIVQTNVWYDGLAQDVPVWTSQWSVILMLIIILYQFSPVRGLFAGKGPKFDRAALRWTNKWHGLYIGWALVYTFWFHPTEGLPAILLGFFYMFLLLSQLSLAGTEVHLNDKWIAVLELMVGLHGPAIAVQQLLTAQPDFGPGMWIMFTVGFLFMFAFTGQYSFKLPVWGRALVYAAYGALVVGLYAWWGFGHFYTITFIPAALYGGVFALAGIAKLASRVGRKKEVVVA
jgi:hypothetical protein